MPATTLCTLCDSYLMSSSLYPSRTGDSTPILQTKQVRLREKVTDLPRVTWVAHGDADLQARLAEISFSPITPLPYCSLPESRAPFPSLMDPQILCQVDVIVLMHRGLK